MNQMTSHFEKLFDQIGHDLGWNEANMQRDRPYSGQSHTDTGVRGKQLLVGVTMRDVRDCFIRAYIMSHPYYKEGTIELVQPNATLIDEVGKGPGAAICENDVYSLVGTVDPIAVAQNLTCELERIMGIFPNVPELHYDKNPPNT